MSEEYFVLVMEEYFGVFDVGASGYPEKFFKNMECVCVYGETGRLTIIYWSIPT